MYISCHVVCKTDDSLTLPSSDAHPILSWENKSFHFNYPELDKPSYWIASVLLDKKNSDQNEAASEAVSLVKMFMTNIIFSAGIERALPS